jgi:hemoglobin
LTISKYNAETMLTIYEAAGGSDGLLRLARAWHKRVLEDEVVSHAFSHGFHPQPDELAMFATLRILSEAIKLPDSHSDGQGSLPSLQRLIIGSRSLVK